MTAERAQVREQAHRAVRRGARLRGDDLPHGVGERARGIAEVVRAAEAREPGARRDEPAAEQRGELVEVEVGHADPMPERVLADREAAVPHGALVECARGHAGTASRSSAATARYALATPSSWNPQPQYAPQ